MRERLIFECDFWFCSWMLKGRLHLSCLHLRVILRFCCFGSIRTLKLAAQIPARMSDRFSDYIYVLRLREPSPSPPSPERTSCSGGVAASHWAWVNLALPGSRVAVGSSECLVASPGLFIPLAHVFCSGMLVCHLRNLHEASASSPQAG